MIIREAFRKKKKIRVVFADDSVAEFEVIDFDDNSGLPGWSVKPDPQPGQKFTGAKKIELLEK